MCGVFARLVLLPVVPLGSLGTFSCALCFSDRKFVRLFVFNYLWEFLEAWVKGGFFFQRIFAFLLLWGYYQPRAL